VKSETNSLEQLSNHGFIRRRSTKAGDVMDCILKLPMSRAEDIHHKGAEGYPLPSILLNICDASGKPLIPARQRDQQPRQQHSMDITAMAR
jgi:hypothetical protein